MKPRYFQHAATYLCLTVTFCLAAYAEELSHARIVRLSFAEGGVSVHRPDVEEWAAAAVNTPLQEGFKVATDEGGFAEIEFENASTARIGQGTILEFTQLALHPTGSKINRMNVVQGYASFRIIPEEGDVYEVTAGSATMTPQNKSLFRVDLDGGTLQVKVFQGSVEIMSPEGNGTLGKNSVLFIRPEAEQTFEIAYGIQKDAWDEWVEDREERVQLVRSMGVHRAFSGYSNRTTDLLWGAMDLMYFGTWVNDPTYGYGWVPTVGPGWSPYTNGRWAWYPGYGYTWIGYEPWGWLPYHYGAWTYNRGIGWCWFPSGGFASWSPALVHWYQGNSWVGWSPQWVGGRDFHDQCPRSQGCIATTSGESFTGGRRINPDGIEWRSPFESGRPIDRVNLEPRTSALLPGTARDSSRIFGRGTTTGGASTSTNDLGISVIGSERGGRTAAASSGISFDSASGRYVQNHEPSPATSGQAAPNSVEFAREHTQAGSAVGSRPAPTNNYPVAPAAWGRQPGTAPRANNSSGSAASDNSDWIRSNAVGWGNPRTDNSSGSASSKESRGSTASGGRSSSGSNSSASSGSGRSGGGNSGWGGSGSSGGSRGSVGGRSGGWGGGGRGSMGGGGNQGGGSRGSIGGGDGRSMGGRSGGGGGARAPR